jgi:hypothetical protein
MKPYLAILKDSFREAAVSRLLWVALALIGILLYLGAMFGYREHVSTTYARGDILDAQAIAYRIVNDDSPRLVHVRGQLSEENLAGIKEVLVKPSKNDRENRGPGRAFRHMEKITTAFNQLLENDEFYDPAAFSYLPPNGELHDLVSKKSEITDTDKKRRNRLLLDGIFREHVKFRAAKRVAPTFAGKDMMPESLALTKEQLDPLLKVFIVPFILTWVVGVAGVQFALAMTAPIIPRMYEAGSLHLLLSKPVRRSFVFLTKFVGGCAFIALYDILLLSGVFLILGLRFDIWISGLLWCIPVFIFWFAILYSVSAVVAVIWKNAILSWGAAAVFWIVCVTVGFAHGVFKAFVDQEQISRVVSTEDSRIGIRENGKMAAWDEVKSNWVDVGGGGRGNLTWLGPVEDVANERILSATATQSPPFMALPTAFTLYTADATDGWRRHEIDSLPKGTAGLFRHPEGMLIVVTNTGVIRVAADAGLTDEIEGTDEVEEAEQPDETKQLDAESTAVESTAVESTAVESNGVESNAAESTAAEKDAEGKSSDSEEKREKKKSGWRSFLPSFGVDDDSLFEPIGPSERLSLSNPVRVTMTPSGSLHLVDASRIVTLDFDAATQEFVLSRNIEFELPVTKKEQGDEDDDDKAGPGGKPGGGGLAAQFFGQSTQPGPLFIESTDNYLLLGSRDGDLFLYDSKSLKLLKSMKPLQWNDEARFVRTSPQDESFYVLNYSNTVHKIDAKKQTLSEPNWPYQGQISALTLLPDGEAVIVSTGDRYTVLNRATGSITTENSPEVPTWIWAYRSIVKPIYYAFPRPSDLEQTVTYLTSDETSLNISGGDVMGATRVSIDPWDPVKGNLIFMALILSFACFIVERQEL